MNQAKSLLKDKNEIILNNPQPNFYVFSKATPKPGDLVMDRFNQVHTVSIKDSHHYLKTCKKIIATTNPNTDNTSDNFIIIKRTPEIIEWIRMHNAKECKVELVEIVEHDESIQFQINADLSCTLFIPTKEQEKPQMEENTIIVAKDIYTNKEVQDLLALFKGKIPDKFKCLVDETIKGITKVVPVSKHYCIDEYIDGNSGNLCERFAYLENGKLVYERDYGSQTESLEEYIQAMNELRNS